MSKWNSRRIQRALLAGTALGALAGLAAPTLAMAAAPADSSQVQEIIVTAQRRSENIQQVPVSIQAFTAKAITDLGIKSSADLGQLTPNVDIAMPAGAGNQPIITIRGIGLNDYDTNNAGPNGIYVDEVYLSAPASQTFQTFDLQRIEVLKGPQGTLYGRNTSGGAINFVSVKPTDQVEGDFHVEYSSFNSFNFEGGIGGPIAPNLDARAALVVNHSDGYMRNDLTGNLENGSNNYATRLQLLWKPTDNLKVLFNVHGGQVDNRPNEYRHIGVLNPSSGALCTVAQTYAGGCVDLYGYGTPKGFYNGAYNRQAHLKVNSLGSYLRADLTHGPITYTSITSFEHNDKIHPEDSDASPNRLLEIDFGVRSNTFTQEFRAAGSGEKYSWVGGVYYLHEDLHQNQPIYVLLDLDKFYGAGAGDGKAYRAYDQSHQVTDAYAVFGQGDYSITDKLKLTLGGRFTGERRTFSYVGSWQYQEGGMDNFAPLTTVSYSPNALNNTAFSWRAAADYHFTSSIHAYASVATGFKSGDFNGSFLGLDHDQIVRELKPVSPETVTAYEVGLKSSLFENRLILDLAAFYNEYKNMQVFVLVPVNGVGVNVLDNAKKAHTDGIDAEVIARPFSRLTTTLNLGLLDTKLDTFIAKRSPDQTDYSGNQLPLSPHVSFSGLVDYKQPVVGGALDFQFGANYKSHQYFDITNDPYTTQGGYWIENARVAYQFDNDRWEVAAFVRNLSDQKYYLDAFDLSFVGFIQAIVGTPRTFGVEANFRY
ncbi:MAG: TonB-dependent receptor [Caulobacteraceae bacterium]|nr:TonB-dependent receptor [Caulobacteraceae bacterium]